MAVNDGQGADMDLRAFVKSLCAPIWWEQGRQTVVNSGSMCVLKTPEALIGITNNHVLKIYEKHKAERDDIFCQLGSAPFDPTANLIACSEYWDLATFRIPALTRRHWGHRVFEPLSWPPAGITMEDHCVYGGYPEYRRQVPPGPNPPTMTADFVSFRANPHGCSDRNVSFQIDTAKLTWLPNVTDPLRDDAHLSGMSGGPCFRIIGAENRIEYAGVIYEGRWDIGIIFVRQACLISANGQIAAPPH
jgi:hypothetical protein